MPANNRVLQIIDDYVSISKDFDKLNIENFLRQNNALEYEPLINFVASFRNESAHCKLSDLKVNDMFTTIRAKWLNNSITERSSQMTKPVHTVTKGNGWVNKQGGRIVSEHRTQSNAIDKAISIAKQGKTEHVIHGINGKIRDKNSYGNDPRNIPG